MWVGLKWPMKDLEHAIFLARLNISVLIINRMFSRFVPIVSSRYVIHQCYFLPSFISVLSFLEWNLSSKFRLQNLHFKTNTYLLTLLVFKSLQSSHEAYNVLDTTTFNSDTQIFWRNTASFYRVDGSLLFFWFLDWLSLQY